MPPEKLPIGNSAREAIDSLRGYVYQIYQSALAWTEIKSDELLILEVAEDYAVVAENALQVVQVKETSSRVTINSNEIVASINSFVELQESNPSQRVFLRHLTTAKIAKEKSSDFRIDGNPTLISWRNLSKSGDLSKLRGILAKSKLSENSKKYISDQNDHNLRENFLKRIHFDCGAPDSHFSRRSLENRVSALVMARGGLNSQADGCAAKILLDLLKRATSKTRNERIVDRSDLEKHLEEATHLTLNRTQFETQNRLITEALSSSMTSGSELLRSSIVKPSLISDVPLPKALANRYERIRPLQRSLEIAGICWISGAAGMGKTTAARVLANRNDGDWASLNLRSQSCEQICFALDSAANVMPTFGLRGMIIDDLDCTMEPSVLECIHYLLHSANRADVLLVLTSSTLPANEFLFATNLSTDIAVTLTEFTDADIKEILSMVGVHSANWAKYVHLVSGGGHPQLAIAFIQSMTASGWNPNELQTLDSFLSGSQAVEDVRKRTRERLLKDLPDASRRLIERLSLMMGQFTRDLVIDLGKAVPQIHDAGTILDTLTGSWVDQDDGNRYSLSPLLSGYATKTLTRDEKRIYQSVISTSLTKQSTLDVLDMNSALLAAIGGHNKEAILKLCTVLICQGDDELEVLASNLPMFTLLRMDTLAYPHDALSNLMLRGAQLLLLNRRDECQLELQNALDRFSEESQHVVDKTARNRICFLIYSKLLLQSSKTGIGTKFLTIVSYLDEQLKENGGVLPTEICKLFSEPAKDGVTAIGVMFINQTLQLSRIDYLIEVFAFLDGMTQERRKKYLALLWHDDFEVDLIVSGAFLHEDREKTVDPDYHYSIFVRLENSAVNWKYTDLAACCRKYQAVIQDEYGNDKARALAILDEGFKKYGATNSVLVRAKAKVLYRSEDHKGSLALSKSLIEGDAPLSAVEKTFLGRDAAISAEREGDFATARMYYLYGSNAAKPHDTPDMVAMRIGLLADAALASWHKGDRVACLQGFAEVLRELNRLKSDETLRTAHCHALARHVLLWLDQEASGEKRLLRNGEDIQIYPGCVSNPEPHPEILSRSIVPIEMAWYMLATVESYAEMDVGISKNLDDILPNGPVIEGQVTLAPARMHCAFSTLNSKQFVLALNETISTLSFAQRGGGPRKVFNFENVTYGRIPTTGKEQQDELRDFAGQYVLLYCAISLFKGDAEEIAEVIQKVIDSPGFLVKRELLERLQNAGPTSQFDTSFAQLIFLECLALKTGKRGTPLQMFDLAVKTLQVARITGNYSLFSRKLLPWLTERWRYVWNHQRFLLNCPALHQEAIEMAFDQGDVSEQEKVVRVLSAILPTLIVSNQDEVSRVLSDLSNRS